MDHAGFDALTRAMAATAPRRAVLALLGALISGAAAGNARAKGKGKGKKCGKGLSPCLNHCLKCGKNETASPDSEGKCQCYCNTGFTRLPCRAGSICVPDDPGCCPEKKRCGSNCIPRTECCHDSEVQCADGTCVKKPGCCKGFDPCPIAPDGCCHTFAGEECTLFDGCCNSFVHTPCDGKWCCKDDEQCLDGACVKIDLCPGQTTCYNGDRTHHTCCALAESCCVDGSGAHCCSSEEYCCGGVCCPFGSSCCGGTCCVGQDGCCGDVCPGFGAGPCCGNIGRCRDADAFCCQRTDGDHCCPPNSRCNAADVSLRPCLSN
ncbi:MAG: hypothetical protein U0031_06125 [Thermomicrobiales bacterium]